MARTIVGILRGGSSPEYDISLKTGAAMLSALREEKYESRDIFIDRTGRWHQRGLPMEPGRILAQVDVVLNALHGGSGEDGTIQRILERSGARYAGSRPLASALTMNKALSYEAARLAGILVPQSIEFAAADGTTADMARATFARFGPPYIVKPARQIAGGPRFASNIAALPEVLGDALEGFGPVIVQEFVRGEDARVGIVEGFRNEELYALPPAHIPKPEGKLLIDSDIRREDLVRHVVPSHFTDAEKRALTDAARAAHRALALSHFSRIDFILAKGKPYLLQASTLPGLYPGAAFPQMLESVGSSVPEFLEHAIALATGRR